MKKYSVTTPEKLRMLCIRRDWFTYGTVAEYYLMFYANERGLPLEVIAAIIRCCSETRLMGDILPALEEERSRYLRAVKAADAPT